MDVQDARRRMSARLSSMKARPQSRGRWYEIIRHQDDEDVAVIRMYDVIDPFWGLSAEDLAEEIGSITASTIEVQINSPGGLVFDGIAIYNALRTHPARVVTRVDGVAASAASVIVQAGDRRVMVESSQLMIHEAWGLAIGPADELREFADLLDKQNGIIAGIYAARSDRNADEFRETMRSDTWLTDQEAVDLGLADEVLVPQRQDDPEEASAAASLRDELRAALNDENLRRELGLPPIPSAGEQQKGPSPTTASTGVDRQRADSLLGTLTLNQQEDHRE